MIKFYDPNLRYMLPTNNSKSDIVLNRAFKRYTNHIADNLRYRIPQGKRYEKGKDRKLLKLCIEHSRDYQKKKIGLNTVMLTHPFYMNLSQMDGIRTAKAREQAEEYLDDLLWFLSLDRGNSDAEFVVLETIHHYAAATSLLVEQGLIDRVIFTLYDHGTPLEEEELTTYMKDTIYFGGGYNGKCLSSSIEAMEGYISSGKIWGIKDIILNSPFEDEGDLKTNYVIGIDDNKVITLNKAIKRLNLMAK